MAFNIFKWLLNTKEDDTQVGTKVNISDFMDNSDTATIGAELYIQKMAFNTAVKKIASAVSAVEWETVRRNKKIKTKEYWSWNYEPNPNQSSEEFFFQAIDQLYKKQEVLIVNKGNYRYVADSFTKTQRLSGDIYQDVVVWDEQIGNVFNSSDVIHLALRGEKIKSLLALISANEGKLIKSAMSNYLRGQGTRGILNISEQAEAEADFEETYNNLVQEKFRSYFENPNAVLPLFEGYNFQQTDTTGGSTKSNIVGTRDIRNMLDDIVEFTAQAFGIPVSILTGKNVAEKDFNAFITSTIQPLVNMISSELNRKLYGRDLVFSGTYITPNMSKVEYKDVFDIANPIDKLIGSGAFCVNDVRKLLGMDTIDEDWAEQHWMTKNYSPTEELMNGVEDTVAPVQPEEKTEEGNTDEESEE